MKGITRKLCIENFPKIVLLNYQIFCVVCVCEQAEPGLSTTSHSPLTDSDSDSDSDATVSSVFTFSTTKQRYISQFQFTIDQSVNVKLQN